MIRNFIKKKVDEQVESIMLEKQMEHQAELSKLDGLSIDEIKNEITNRAKHDLAFFLETRIYLMVSISVSVSLFTAVVLLASYILVKL